MKGFLLSIIVVLIISSLVLGFMYLDQKSAYENIYDILKNQRTTAKMIINGEYVDKKPIIGTSGTYIPIEIALDYIDSTLEYSNSGARLYVDLKQLDFELETKTLTEFVKTHLSHMNIPIRVIEGEKYLNLALLEKIYPIQYEVLNDQVLYLETDDFMSYYQVIEETSIAFLQQDLMIEFDELAKDDVLIFVEEKKINEIDYLKVATSMGELGYIDKAKCELKEDRVRSPILNTIREDMSFNKVNLIWDYITNYNDEKNYKMDEMEGLNVISPTWFSLNVNGIVLNEASLSYTALAHEKNYAVWGLFSNSFDPDWTRELLTNEAYQNKAISQILFYSSLYNLDGINIDFENIYIEEKQSLVDFVMKMRAYTQMQNLQLSIDAVVPGGSDRYSKVIDRPAIEPFVDYFILMAYDEHWGSSPKSGSVASIPWVKKGIEGTLESIPSEKLVLGVPLYMRVWTEVGNRVTGSKAYAIKNIGSFLEAYDYSMIYDEDSGQNYIEIKEGNKTFKIWLEDKLSIEKRINLINDYNLKGIAGWRKDYEESFYWDLIDIYMKE